ncbi:32656_t:CDS:2 [Gigaspora margarita]|uniref:32656_t:CDS:1 n=1 Tax=Gigaspora margarita TaxID=4874 RepID=A0ABN7UXV0_GIGMA|nr:32656_t:CDS:2 [Gigaspora margarita]
MFFGPVSQSFSGPTTLILKSPTYNDSKRYFEDTLIIISK